MVFGDGAQDAEILLIGEGPGQHEDERVSPLWDEAVSSERHAGDDWADRTNVYIANVVKCRPPQNRDPLHVEQEACMDFLRRQAALLQSKIIVCLGRIAAKAIIKEDFKITSEHGQWFERGGVQMTATFHPAALLRDVSKRPDAFEDLKSIQAKIREICKHTEV